MSIPPRTSAFAAVIAAVAAVTRVRDQQPSAEMQQAMELARALEKEVSGRPQADSAYTVLRGLRNWVATVGEEAVAAVEALTAANDAVTYLHLDSDPSTASMKAIEAAIRAGVDRTFLEEAIRAARFR